MIVDPNNPGPQVAPINLNVAEPLRDDKVIALIAGRIYAQRLADALVRDEAGEAQSLRDMQALAVDEAIDIIVLAHVAFASREVDKRIHEVMTQLNRDTRDDEL